jgi:tetratricopeptide (TPR) repeat protein
LFSDSARQIAAAEGENLSFAERTSNLARVLIKLGMSEPAFFMFGTVTNIHRRELGTRDPLYADSLYNYANAAADIGRKNDSVRYHLEALEIRETINAPAEDIINSLHSLAFLHEASAEYEKAAAYAHTAVKYAVGNDHTYARSCNYLAGLYENAKKYENALNFYEQVLVITNSEVGYKSSTYLNVALRRANLLTLMERLNEALTAHEEVRDIFVRLSGKKHIFYANCLRGMAIIHKKLNNHLEAESSIMESIKIRRKMLEDITLDITFLINLYLQENNLDKALEALVYALMCSEECTELQNMLAEIFAQVKTPVFGSFISNIELLNDKEKLRPFINKWTAWEKEN